jgi:hypothetical protein
VNSFRVCVSSEPPLNNAVFDIRLTACIILSFNIRNSTSVGMCRFASKCYSQITAGVDEQQIVNEEVGNNCV